MGETKPSQGSIRAGSGPLTGKGDKGGGGHMQTDRLQWGAFGAEERGPALREDKLQSIARPERKMVDRGMQDFHSSVSGGTPVCMCACACACACCLLILKSSHRCQVRLYVSLAVQLFIVASIRTCNCTRHTCHAAPVPPPL